MVAISEENLIKLCLEGNNQAWNTMYSLHYSRVRRIVAWPKWGFSPSEAEEIVQEVFLELVKSLPNYRGEAQITTFLSHLAKNRCVSELRRRLAKKRGKEDKKISIEDERKDFDEPQIVAIEKGPSPLEQLIIKEEVESILRMLPSLSSECQQVIALRFFNDKSYEEICSDLDIPLGTLCSRLKRCLLKLRKVVMKNN